MLIALVAALAAAFSFGIGSVVQRAGASRSPGHARLGPRLVCDLARQPLFVLGALLDAAGFGLTFVALGTLPLFAVEAIVSGAVAVTAVAGARWLGDPLRPGDRRAVVVVVAGLALVALSAEPESAAVPGPALQLLLLAGLPGLAVLAQVCVGRAGGAAGPLLGALAGGAFAGFGLASRFVGDGPVLAEPMVWCATLYVVLGLTLYGAALQRSRATTVAAASTGIEVLLPAGVGLLFSEGARPGMGTAAALGFLLTVAGVWTLVRRSQELEIPLVALVGLPVGNLSKPSQTAQAARLNSR